MSNSALVPWDRLAAGIRQRLPEWARYRGKATWAFVAGIYGVGMLLLATYTFLAGRPVASGAFAVVAAALLSIADYYRKAAKKRTECANCGRPARGWDECPQCGQPTFREVDNA